MTNFAGDVSLPKRRSSERYLHDNPDKSNCAAETFYVLKKHIYTHLYIRENMFITRDETLRMYAFTFPVAKIFITCKKQRVCAYYQGKKTHSTRYFLSTY